MAAFLQLAQVDAQSFSISPNPTFGTADLDDNPFTFEFSAETFITNNTSAVLTLSWEKIVNDIPECWQTGVSDITVTPPMVNFHQFEIGANSENNVLYVTTYPMALSNSGAASGEGHVILKVSNVDVPGDTVLVDYFFSATGGISCSTTGISEKGKGEIKIYPNPSSDFIQLTENAFIKEIVLSNLIGEVIRTFNASTNQTYDIADLPRGVYLVELMGANDESLKTLKLLKE